MTRKEHMNLLNELLDELEAYMERNLDNEYYPLMAKLWIGSTQELIELQVEDISNDLSNMIGDTNEKDV